MDTVRTAAATVFSKVDKLGKLKKRGGRERARGERTLEDGEKGRARRMIGGRGGGGRGACVSGALHEPVHSAAECDRCSQRSPRES